MSRKIFYAILTFALVVPALITAQQQKERVDLNVIHRIKTAEFGGGGGWWRRPRTRSGGANGSQVMDIMWNLTDHYGPRLTNSPQFRAAGEWAVTQMKEWGLSNVHLEKWSTDDVTSGPIPGWQVKGYSGAMVRADLHANHRHADSMDQRHRRTGDRRSGYGPYRRPGRSG